MTRLTWSWISAPPPSDESLMEENLSTSMERSNDVSCTSRSESFKDSSLGNSSAGVSVFHAGCLMRHDATRVRYVRQCSGHEKRWMFLQPLFWHSCHKFFSDTSLRRAFAIPC